MLDKFFNKSKGEVSEQAVKNPIHLTQSAMKQVKDFERDRIENSGKSEKIAWRVATGSMLIAGLAVAAVYQLTPLKSVELRVLRVDKSTGAVDELTLLKDGKEKYGEALDKAFLTTYVRNRESYDWETIQATYDETISMSTSEVANEFRRIYDKPDAPHKTLKNQYKIITKVNAISFIGDVAQIRFENSKMMVGGALVQNVIPTHWIATIAYRYDNIPMKEEERRKNPLGFKVTSYRVDPESVSATQ